MWLVYYISVTTVGGKATDWANEGVFGDGWSLFGLVDVPGIPVLVENGLKAIHCADWLSSLILDGVVAGVGAVLGFVPQILILFIFLAFLEGCGYMSRVAFIMDRIFRKFGLSGKSFIPMLIGSGCGVPGVMASRTIENDRDRKMTIMTTTYLYLCSAKLPIIALIAGALFDGIMGCTECLLCRCGSNYLLRYYFKENKDVCRRSCPIRLWNFLHIIYQRSVRSFVVCGNVDGHLLKRLVRSS